VSGYALGPNKRVYQLQVVASGVGGLCLSAACVGLGASVVANLALVAYGVTRIAIAAYPTDARGAQPTPTGRNHAILAATAFLSLAVAAPFATATLPPEIATHPASTLLAVLAALVTITSLGSFVVAALPRTVPYYGVAQRVCYVAGFAWAIATSAAIAIA